MNEWELCDSLVLYVVNKARFVACRWESVPSSLLIINYYINVLMVL